MRNILLYRVDNIYIHIYIYILSNERSMASNDTDNRAEKRVFGKIKKILRPRLMRRPEGAATGEGIGLAGQP